MQHVTAVLNTASPIARLAIAMHDSDEEDVVGFNGVEYGIRKNVDKITSNVVFKNSPAIRRITDLC